MEIVENARPKPSRRFWPGHWLVPYLDPLRTQLMPPLPSDIAEHERVEAQLEQLPYCLGATSFAFLEFVETLVATAEAALAKHHDKNGILVLRPYERDRLGFLVDSVLEAGRRTQNALIPYLGRALRVSLPSSLADLVKSLADKPDLLPDPVKTNVLRYWLEGGFRLRDYRDVSQHHAVVASDVRVFRAPDGAPFVFLVLPNNPEVKNPAKFEYREPFVFAYPFLFEQFQNLVRICNLVCQDLVDKSRLTQVLFTQPLKGGLIGGRPAGHRVPDPNETYEVLRKHMPNLREPIHL